MLSKLVTTHESWHKKLHDQLTAPYFQELSTFVENAYKNTVVYPAPLNIFRAFELTPFETVKVVILGQDPYHGSGQATGLSFAVADNVHLPPSLKNILKEVESDLDLPIQNKSGDLSRWALQGVLLLNSVLTVQAGLASSHTNKGWEVFTDSVISSLSNNRDSLVFILWGNYARKKKVLINTAKHCVLESTHPSPFSASYGFFGSKPFSSANAYLAAQGDSIIQWL